MKTLTISLPIDIYKKLEELAIEEDRSKSYLIRKAVENYIKNEPNSHYEFLNSVITAGQYPYLAPQSQEE